MAQTPGITTATAWRCLVASNVSPQTLINGASLVGRVNVPPMIQDTGWELIQRMTRMRRINTNRIVVRSFRLIRFIRAKQTSWILAMEPNRCSARAHPPLGKQGGTAPAQELWDGVVEWQPLRYGAGPGVLDEPGAHGIPGVRQDQDGAIRGLAQTAEPKGAVVLSPDSVQGTVEGRITQTRPEVLRGVGPPRPPALGGGSEPGG